MNAKSLLYLAEIVQIAFVVSLLQSGPGLIRSHVCHTSPIERAGVLAFLRHVAWRLISYLHHVVKLRCITHLPFRSYGIFLRAWSGSLLQYALPLGRDDKCH